jgi:hypothetical protein
MVVNVAQVAYDGACHRSSGDACAKIRVTRRERDCCDLCPIADLRAERSRSPRMRRTVCWTTIIQRIGLWLGYPKVPFQSC